MGMVTIEIELANPSKPGLKPLSVRARVDTGAMPTCIPEHVAVQLQLDAIEKRPVTNIPSAVVK